MVYVCGGGERGGLKKLKTTQALAVQNAPSLSRMHLLYQMGVINQ
jgi:hypothetical protein